MTGFITVSHVTVEEEFDALCFDENGNDATQMRKDTQKMLLLTHLLTSHMLVEPEKNCEKAFDLNSDPLGQYNLPTRAALL